MAPLRWSHLLTLWSLDILGAHQPALRQGLDVQVANGAHTHGPIVHLDIGVGLATLAQCEAPIEMLVPVISGAPSVEAIGITSFSHALESLLTPMPSDPKARLYFFHLTQSVLRVISSHTSVLGELCSGTLAPLFSSVLLSMAKLRDFSFGMNTREVLGNQNVVHGLLLGLCNEAMPRRTLLESIVAPGSHDAVVLEPLATPTSNSEKKDVPEEPPLIVQNLEQMAAMGFGPLTARHALTAAGGNVEVATNAILAGDVPEEHELEDHVVNQSWERLLERQGLRDAVDAYYRQQRQRNFQQADIENDSDGEKELFLGRHEWPTPVDTHFLKEKSSWLGISEAESQEAVATLVAMQQAGTLLYSRVLFTKQAAKFWRFANNHSDTEKHYRVGDKLVIIDLVNKVCNAEVMEVKESEKTIYIHYTGWSKK